MSRVSVQKYIAILILVVIFGLNDVGLAVEPNEVVVWEHSEFHGDSHPWILAPGMRHRLVDQFPGWLNDEISSIEVGSEVKVIIYRHADYAGPSKTYEGKVSSLSSYWNDEISSLIIFPKTQADPSGVVLSDTAFNTVTGYEPAHQFFPLPENLDDKNASYPGLGNYMNDNAEYVLIQGDNIEVELFKDSNFDEGDECNLILPQEFPWKPSCSSQATGNWNGYQTFRLSGCICNLEGEVSSLKVRSTEPAEAQSYGTTSSAEPTSHRAPPATSTTDAPRLKEILPDISDLGQPIIPEGGASLELIPRLSGRVYVGEVGVESDPMVGVSLELYCSNDPTSLGEVADLKSTNPEGWYELTAPSGCQFYSIKVILPLGYFAAGATSVGGKVIDSSTIQYDHPIRDHVLTGNKFWVKPSTSTGLDQPIQLAPELLRCTEGCACMTEFMAEEEFKRYEQCSEEICGYHLRTPMYCFRPLEGPSPHVCPEGCECMTEEMAEQEFRRYEQCSDEICGNDNEGTPLFCFRPV